MKSTSSTTLGCSCSTSSSSLLSLSERENWIRIQFKSNDIAVDIITPIVTIWWRCLHYCCAFCCIVATESEIFQAKAAEACNKTFFIFWVHDRVNIRRLSLGRVVDESSIFLSSSFEFSSTSGDDIRRHWSYEREVDLLNWFFFLFIVYSVSHSKLTIVWQTSLLHGEHSSLAWIKKKLHTQSCFPRWSSSLM